MYVDIHCKYSRAALVLFKLESYVDSVKRKMVDYGWIVAKAPKRNACLPDPRLSSGIPGG